MMFKTIFFKVTTLAAALGLGWGCASTQTDTSPRWRQSMTGVFSNDSVTHDETPREYWSAADEELLLRRMGFADTVMVGTLRLLSQVERGEVTGELTLAFTPEEVLYGTTEGKLDGAGELTLQPEPGSEEFSRLSRVTQELTGVRYLLFLKRPADGSIRWGIYRPSPSLLAEVRNRYAALRRHQEGSGGS
jgi:hypothetical protein